MIQKYWVLEANTAKALLDAVNKEIADGWQPLGGVSVTSYKTHNDFFTYTQAIVLYVSDK